jgi:hypothetical protein
MFTSLDKFDHAAVVGCRARRAEISVALPPERDSVRPAALVGFGQSVAASRSSGCGRWLGRLGEQGESPDHPLSIGVNSSLSSRLCTTTRSLTGGSDRSGNLPNTDLGKPRDLAVGIELGRGPVWVGALSGAIKGRGLCGRS